MRGGVDVMRGVHCTVVHYSVCCPVHHHVRDAACGMWRCFTVTHWLYHACTAKPFITASCGVRCRDSGMWQGGHRVHRVHSVARGA